MSPAPGDIAQAVARALAHWAAGQADQAEQLCQRIIAGWPGQADALHLMGLMAHAYGNLDLAIERGADVALIIGANDVVNPAASSIKALPMFGMPALNAGLAKKIYVVKRGAGTGYAGLENPSFHDDHCNVIYGDAQTVLIRMIDAMRVEKISAAA